MAEKYLILSDIHGNVSAFDAVLADCRGEDFAGIILLGDDIDYGMRSDDIIKKIAKLSETEWKGKVLVNIWGNHEKLLIDRELERLSTDRGRVMARYTAKNVSPEAVRYIETEMCRDGVSEFSLCEYRCLAVHGSLEDVYWKSISPENLRGEYAEYDFVFSGHSHYPHCFSHFYPVENPELRNKKAVTFVNPGSVGQPRNQNPYAQYAVLSLPSKRIELRATEYDVAAEQALFPEEIDPFYKTRLTRGV